VELWVARRQRKRVYRFADAIGDMGCGIAQQMSGLFVGGVLVAGYGYFHQHYSLIHFEPGSAAPWVIAFVAVDFLYYWWHRLSHTVNVMWAAHITHHQSEDYNLAVALRQSVITSSTSWPFYLPMAFLGVPPVAMVTMVALSSLYQFWIHTELIGKLGFLEWVINTPASHRVHHAINPQYLDKNFGATFIIWDVLFGTYAPEVEPPVYGITHALRSFNPLWAQVHYWVDLVQATRRIPRLADKLRLWVKSPAWRPPGAEAPAPTVVSVATFRKYDPAVSPNLRLYVGAHFAVGVAVTFTTSLLSRQMGRPALLTVLALMAFTLVCWTGLTEGKAWAPRAEVARIALISIAALTAFWGRPSFYGVVLAILGMVVAAWVTLRSWRPEPLHS